MTQHSPDKGLSDGAGGVSIAVLKGDLVLLVKRGLAPYAGLWSLPGGKIEPGETPREAVLRELKEETRIEAEVEGILDMIEVVPEKATEPRYRLIVFYGRYSGGQPAPGGDAEAARWFAVDEIKALPMTEGIAPLIWLAAHRMRPVLNG